MNNSISDTNITIIDTIAIGTIGSSIYSSGIIIITAWNCTQFSLESHFFDEYLI